MPNNNNCKKPLKSSIKNTSALGISFGRVSSGGPSLLWDDFCETELQESHDFFPTTSISDSAVLSVYDFLDTLIKGHIKELDYKETDTVKEVFQKLNKRIAKCKKFRDDGFELSEKLVNNYVIISNYDECCKEEVAEEENISYIDLEYEVYKNKKIKQLCIGYIYRIVLDIRSESFFHVYLRPLIYTDTLGRSANLVEEEVRNVSFEELSTAYKTITGDEYERKIKELFIKNNEK